MRIHNPSVAISLFCSLASAWTTTPTGTSATLRAIDRGGNHIVGDSGTILYVPPTTSIPITPPLPSSRGPIRRETSGTTRNLHGISCGNKCVAVGDSGTILYRADTTWTAFTVGTRHALRSIFFDEDSLLAGDSGTILRKQGNSWNRMPSGVSEDLHFIQFQNHYLGGPNPNRYDTGFAVGKNGTILKSTNRGASWTKLTSGTTRSLYSGHFWNYTAEGFVVGDSGLILRTSDRGGSWTQIPSGTLAPLHSISFSSVESSGIIAGGNGVILTTTNGGSTWNIENTGISQNLFGAVGGKAVGANGTFLELNPPGSTALAPNLNFRPNLRPTRFFDLRGRRIEVMPEGVRTAPAPVVSPKE